MCEQADHQLTQLRVGVLFVPQRDPLKSRIQAAESPQCFGSRRGGERGSTSSLIRIFFFFARPNEQFCSFSMLCWKNNKKKKEDQLTCLSPPFAICILAYNRNCVGMTFRSTSGCASLIRRSLDLATALIGDCLEESSFVELLNAW